MAFPFISPIRIEAGENALERVPSLLEKYSAEKILVFADPGVVSAGIASKLTDLLDREGYDYYLYDALEPEPPVAVGDAAADAVRSEKADLVIGIGGGSSLDIAKAAAVMQGNEGSLANYLNLSGNRAFHSKGVPKILIPTTAGTGAEITDIAVFSLEQTKDVLTHEYLLADAAIIDPALTYTVPPKVTAATGVDALTHAVEALISVNATPLTDALAMEAIRRISGSLRTAVAEGENKKARDDMAWGSMIAGLSFYNAGVSGVHALAYPLGGMFKVPHGEANAVLLPYIFDFIWPHALPKMKMMADALGVLEIEASDEEAAKAAVRELRDIVKDVEIPPTLKEFGVKENDLDKLAEAALGQKRLLARSPKEYSLEDIRGRYEAALNGTLNITSK
ncbi:iron-containing alcohol dehydrogenase [Alkalicoccus halolimnae]|uniref:Iron-containing alcohol dehydrogenase n=1 Tax=Alkalicoccus halolimnae TaxID=1667239 RepID=A0A5C7FEV8_9BACI|nr:iron-containing alcohol dehydrogenase [Alkalicoccus halolimnae]TXF82713.1 iron-containing alcohol dehydrogenase [Alkalicoccus halolimnae]